MKTEYSFDNETWYDAPEGKAFVPGVGEIYLRMNNENTASQPKAASIGDDAQFRILTRAWRENAPLAAGSEAWRDLVAYLDSKLSAPADQAASVAFQQRVLPWMMECFGSEISADKMERNHRFFEEATELVQAAGMTRSEAHQLVNYTYGRPVGDLPQEVGGVMVTLAALCLAHGQDMHEAGEVELARIWTKVAAIRAKQAAKPRHSPLPEAAPQQSLAPAAGLSFHGYSDEDEYTGETILEYMRSRGEGRTDDLKEGDVLDVTAIWTQDQQWRVTRAGNPFEVQLINPVAAQPADKPVGGDHV